MTGRLIVLLVVMTAMVASRQAVAIVAAPMEVENRRPRASWIDRLEVGLSKSLSRSALFQRLALTCPPATPMWRDDLNTHPIRRESFHIYRFCLPPPMV